MSNLEKLSSLINISENSILDTSVYGDTISILACNKEVKEISDLEKILQESVPDDEFAVILNSIHEHLHNMYEISEFKLEKRKVRKRKREAKIDPQRSRLMKMVWKKNKSKMMKGLSKFHKSSKGKTFEKALSKFVASRTKKQESVYDLDINELTLSLNELRISLSSGVTQLLIDMKSNPEHYSDFPTEDFNELIDVYGEVMKDLQDAYASGNPERIEDAMDEAIAEFASVMIGIHMDYIYDDYDTPHDSVTE